MRMAEICNGLCLPNNKPSQEVISTKLDKRQVGHLTFQVQYQVDDMLKSFERRVIIKFDETKASGRAKGTSTEDDKEAWPSPGGGY